MGCDTSKPKHVDFDLSWKDTEKQRNTDHDNFERALKKLSVPDEVTVRSSFEKHQVNNALDYIATQWALDELGHKITQVQYNKYCDTMNVNYMINFEQFKTLAYAAENGGLLDDTIMVFSIADINQDGIVSEDELQKYIQLANLDADTAKHLVKIAREKKQFDIQQFAHLGEDLSASRRIEQDEMRRSGMLKPMEE